MSFCLLVILSVSVFLSVSVSFFVFIWAVLPEINDLIDNDQALQRQVWRDKTKI